MEAKEVVNLIQLYRHDLLNHLQIIHGYVKMGKLEKVEANMSKLFDYIDNERDLFKLDIPHVVLWFFEFRKRYEQFQLSYEVDVNKLSLNAADMHIKDKLEQIMQDVKNISSEEELYTVQITLTEEEHDCIVEVSINIGESEIQTREFISLEGIKVVQQPKNRVYSFQVRTS
ncbi:Spo0B domain-containing protein [Oceanobacillus luteolus]|uniref:Spo0B domain-containing protein n=1 Tax=Oceanobacillus luteolus TaxID=1274358 RepID=A0ABW4HUE8_9BACI|nr:Spo0B domain-containing protein [Oceanobacillus luteolus]MCM3742150.1 Spo0B domain-containing protein [Oceanobacillus luteolus]